MKERGRLKQLFDNFNETLNDSQISEKIIDFVKHDARNMHIKPEGVHCLEAAGDINELLLYLAIEQNCPEYDRLGLLESVADVSIGIVILLHIFEIKIEDYACPDMNIHNCMKNLLKLQKTLLDWAVGIGLNVFELKLELLYVKCAILGIMEMYNFSTEDLDKMVTIKLMEFS